MFMGTREDIVEKKNTDRAPLVSVIMGTYEPDLSELAAAVRSIRMQTLASWELLICDDGSREETYQGIRKIAASDRRIRIARNSKNRGLAYALNRCIRSAGGEFIARMDADDISRPERLREQVRFLRENPGYMWVSCTSDLFEGNRIWGRAHRPERPDERSFLHSSPYIHPAVMFRREVFFSSACPDPANSVWSENSVSTVIFEKQIRKNSPKRLYHISPLTVLCEDYELFMRLHSEGFRGYNLQEPLLLYREKERTMHRPFRRCFFEMIIRMQGFKRMGILSPKTFFSVAKPIFVWIASLFPDIAQHIRTGGMGWDRKDPGREHGSGSAHVTYGDRILKDVFTPLIVSFTVWTLREAKKRGIRRLYFLSRDGCLPYRTAERLVKSCKLDIECRYLYCSRYSLRVPMYSENIDEALSHVSRGGIDVTFRKILMRSDLRPEDMAKMQAEFPDIAFDEVIPYSMLSKIRERLAESRTYTDLLTSRSKEAWEPLHAYFAQEGLLEGAGACSGNEERSEKVSVRSGKPEKAAGESVCNGSTVKIGIVDSGWTGTTQKSVDEIRKRCGIDDPVEGFYFGLFEIPKGSDPGRYHSYYFGPKTKLFNKVFFSNSLFEALVRANHGTVSGYRKVNVPGMDAEDAGCIMEPILEPFRKNGIAERLDQHINEYLNEISEREATLFEELVSQSAPENKSEAGDSAPGEVPAGYDGSLTREVTRRLKKFMWNPSPEEAEYFGSLPFSDDLLDETEREVAPVFPVRYLKENHFANRLLTSLGIRKGMIHESAWFEATCVRSTGQTVSSEYMRHAGRAASIRHRISFSFYKTVSYLRKGLSIFC